MTTDDESQPAPQTDWDARAYDEQYGFIWEHGLRVVELLSPKQGEHILDLGCGTGHLTYEIASWGANVLGVDVAPAMIEQAHRNYPGLKFVLADARDMTFAHPFDAVFSNAAIHWIPEPERVVCRVADALRPGGRFVAEFGGRGNVARIISAIQETLREQGIPDDPRHFPWYYPTIGQYAGLLDEAGLETTSAVLFERPTPLEGGEEGLRRWIAMFARSFLALVPDELREDFLARVEARLRPAIFLDGTWVADYRRIRLVAIRLSDG